MKKTSSKKIKIEDTYNGFNIEILWSKNWVSISFIIIWLIGWVTIGAYVSFNFISSFFGESLLMTGLAIYVSFMMLAGLVYGVGLLRWMTFGKEIIIVNNRTIQIDIKNYYFYKNKEYKLIECKNLHVGKSYYLNKVSSEKRYYIFKLSKYGTVKFDCGEKPISFGLELNQEDGNMIVEKFKSKGFISQ